MFWSCTHRFHPAVALGYLVLTAAAVYKDEYDDNKRDNTYDADEDDSYR